MQYFDPWEDEALWLYEDAQLETFIWYEAPGVGGGALAPTNTTSNSTHTFTTATPHAFVPLRVVSKVSGTWVLADKDGPRDIFVVVNVPDDTHFTVGLAGKFEITHGFGAEPVDLFLGDGGMLTTTPPPTQPVDSTNPRVQLAIATVLDASNLWINPERRAW